MVLVRRVAVNVALAFLGNKNGENLICPYLLLMYFELEVTDYRSNDNLIEQTKNFSQKQNPLKRNQDTDFRLTLTLSVFDIVNDATLQIIYWF